MITKQQLVAIMEDQAMIDTAGAERCAAAFLALIEKEPSVYRQQRNALVEELVPLFEWTDTSYLHAVLHVKNAVLNERTTAKGRIEELEQALGEIRWVINEDPAGRKIAKIERVLDRVVPSAED